MINIKERNLNLVVSWVEVSAFTCTYGGRYPEREKFKTFKTLELAKVWAEKQDKLKSISKVSIGFYYSEPIVLDDDGRDRERDSGRVWHGEIGAYLYSASY